MVWKKRYTWHKIADDPLELEFSAGGLTTVEAGGKKFCLALQKGILYACTYKCPHAGGILADGYLDAAGNLVCPHHRYKFSLQNGRNVSGEGYYLKTFPVEARAEGVFIGIADSSLFGGLK
jgi:nitrite reductase/ring-hydroxylating ferredoxin subunit